MKNIIKITKSEEANYQNMLATEKFTLVEKFRAIQAYIKEKSSIQ